MPVRSMKARELLAILQRAPLGYTIVRQAGSHRTLAAEGRQPVTFSFHDGQTIGPSLVRRILCQQVGLTDAEIDALL